LRGALSPVKATICEVAGVVGNKFTLVYKDYTFEAVVQKIAKTKLRSGGDHFVPRCAAGGGTLATCRTDLKPGEELKIAAPFDVKHPNRHIIKTRFGANGTKNATPRELPKFLMDAQAGADEYWHIVDTQMSLELD
jgi:hypothetical protein